MITVRFYDEENKEFSAQAIKASANGGVQTPVSRTDAHDESLDTCLLSILTDGHDLPEQKPYVEEWTKVRVSFDGDEKDYFVTQCDSTVVARKRPENGVKKTVYKVELQLIELIFVTQYISMDNLIFSHDIDENGNVITKTIKEVLARVNYQIYTMPEEFKYSRKGEYAEYSAPFDMELKSEWWENMPAPELYFNGKTLFQILVEIGDVVGGFPYLTYISHGIYSLGYRKWNDNNVARHTLSDSEMEYVEYHTTTDGSATVVDSTVENMLNSSVNGENTAVCPLPGNEDTVVSVNNYNIKMARNNNFVPPRTESYEYEITKNNCFFEVPHPIEKVLRLETYSKKNSGAAERGYCDITSSLKEYSEWITLKETTNDKNSRNYYLYYSIGGRRIENINNAIGNIEIADEYGGSGFTTATQLFLRVTYIPRLNGRIKKQRGTNEKPISYIVNQQSNVVNSSAYGKYLQGLVDRMTGNYTVYTVVNERNPKTNNQKYTLFKKGEFLNGERIYRAEHTYSPKAVISKYYTSKNWNRRANFVAVPHNQRTWRIPAADEVVLRNLHYAEDVFVSVGELMPYNDVNYLSYRGYIQKSSFPILGNYTRKTRKGTVAGVENQDINFARPALAYIAFKNNRKINGDAEDQSNGYAMASCDPVPVDKSIIMTWTAEDNASMGTRSYDKGLKQWRVERQAFCPYPEKAEFLQFKLSSESPAIYNYNASITGINAKEEEDNLSFCLGYPFLTKKQFNSAGTKETYFLNQYVYRNKGTADSPEWEWGNVDVAYTHLGAQAVHIPFIKIDKDLRERIAFTYQLDFKGYGETIVYPKACEWAALCNKNETRLRVYKNSSKPYSEYDVDGKGVEITAQITNVVEDAFSIGIYFKGAFSWNNLAICDKNGDLMFATNKAGSVPTRAGLDPILFVSFFNALKKWKKI